MLMPKETEIPVDKLMSVDTQKAPTPSRVQPMMPDIQPEEDSVEISSEKFGTVFEATEIAEMHDQQKALEVDRREQERSAREKKLADRD